ncbi:MAG TPA: hypothetical protein VJ892_04675 [Candidatus Absconditabacterales bacterium]|nr:hypothetical protein [Candidatus Absconditabacterales bacterium]
MVEKPKNKESILDNLGLGKFGEQLKELKDKILGFFGIELEGVKKEKEESEKETEKETNDSLNNLENGSLENYRKLFDSIKDRAVNGISMELVENNRFVKVEYEDSVGGRVWGMIPTDWNGDSNIYMPGDRSGIDESLKAKNIVENITSKGSKKAWFIFEGDANQINGDNKASRYNGVVNNFSNMVAPLKSKGKIRIIGHSRAGSAVNKILGKYPDLVDKYTIIDGVYGNYSNVKNNSNGEVYYTNGGGNTIVNNQSGYENIVADYKNSGHEEIVNKVFENENLYA